MKFSVCLFLWLFNATITLQAQSKSTDEFAAVQKTIQNYFDGMIKRDRAMLEKAFLPEARLIGYRGTVLNITPFSEWVNGVSAGAPRNPTDYKNKIVSIQIKGYSAVVEAELYWPEIFYYDFLTLIKINDEWKIVHKTWYEEPLSK